MRHALRSLAKSPGFTVVALVTLALGIGANTTAFSVLNTLLLHVPPYPQPNALVRVFSTSPQSQTAAHSPANFLDYHSQNTVFQHTAAIRFNDFNLGEPGQPADRIRGMTVSGDFFPLLGVTPQLGRTFAANEDKPGGDSVVVLSHETWRTRFSGDPAVIGRTLRIDGEPATVIGVMPASFADPLLWGDVAAWRPMQLPDAMTADRENSYLRVIARLKPGFTLARAQTGLQTLASQLAAAYPAVNTGRSVRLVSLGGSANSDTARRITWLLTGLAGFVLLIACANLANLQFARNVARAREHAIRVALGASRTQLMRLVLTESLLLSLIGGALGLIVSVWTNEYVGKSITIGDRAGLDVPLDLHVLAFTFLASALSGIGFGLLPAWLASQANAGEVIKQGSRGSTAATSQNRVRRILVIAQVALALMLLASAGLFLRGLQRVMERETGWRTDNVITAALSLRGPNYTTSAARGAFYRRLHERLLALPGVQHVAIATSAPTSGYDTGNTFVVEGNPPPTPGNRTVADVSAVTPGYFATLGIRLLRGRDFTEADRTGNPAVVLINETMARQFWPGENPIGKRIGGATPFMSNPREIIGVVSDVRPAATLDDRGGRFQFYRSLAQWSFNSATIVLRSDFASESVARDLQRALAEIDPDQAIYRVSTVENDIRHGLRPATAASRLLLAFALLGLLLAALGIYGVISHSVVQRTNEIGIRMALGAHVRDILRLILGGGLRLTLLGAGAGIAGALAVTRLMASFGPEFAAIDPVLTLAVTIGLIAVAMFACWLPARRAAHVDPAIALRAE